MTQRKETAEQLLPKIQSGFNQLRQILIERFTNDNSTVMTNHSDLRQNLYRFNGAKATTRNKVEVNKYVRENMQKFIHTYIAKKLANISKDPHSFVATLNEVWTQYQIFVFCHFFACQKFSEYYSTFYRMANVKDYEYKTIYSRDDKQKFEVAPVCTIGVNELKDYFDKIDLINRFKNIFNQFLLYEREGKNVPQSEIRECVHSLQGCYYDMDAICVLQDQKPRINKRSTVNQKISLFRKSKDTQFFSDHLLQQTINDLKAFYQRQVEQKLIPMNSTDEIRKILSTIKDQQIRSAYYIHSKQNRAKYLDALNSALIANSIQKRILKADGIAKYIQLYEEGKQDFEKEIKDFWVVYSRVIDSALPCVVQIFKEYLLNEAQKVCQKIKVPPDFIGQLIRVNGKCLKIIQFCGKNFDLENERTEKIRDMLTNVITERGKKQAKFDVGAKNLASFINNKFKTSYSKGGIEALGDIYKKLVGIFKILLQKSRFIDEYHKHLSNRLQQDIQFEQDRKTDQNIAMQKMFIDQIQKECGISQVRELSDVVKDIQKSIEHNNKIKQKLGADKLFPLNQIIIKGANNWPQRSTYNIENPPSLILKACNNLTDYFKRSNTNIQFELNSGVSSFRGDYDTGKKQNFQFKNIYLLILLYLDESGKLYYGDIKKRIEAVGVNRQKGQIQLAKAIIQLLYAGLISSPTKSIKPGTPNICKITETDIFQVNRRFDFVEEEKRKKGGKGPVPKPVPILKSNILGLSQELKKGFEEETRAFNDDQKKIEAERKYKVECITVKTLKHAHHHNMNCNIEQLFKVTQQGRNKEFRVTQKFLKQIVEELINKKYCERIEGQRNIFRYIA